MAFSGRLEDLPVPDALQFLHVSARSGTLRLTDPQGNDVSLLMHSGSIISAWASDGHRMTDVLREKHGLGADAVDKALARQRTGDSRPIGVLLVEQKAVTEKQVEEAVRWLIEDLVQRVLDWNEGAFEFDAHVQPSFDGVAFFPDTLETDAGVDVRQLLTAAVRVFDDHERNRVSAAEGTSQTPAPTSVASPTNRGGPLDGIGDGSDDDIEFAVEGIGEDVAVHVARCVVVLIANELALQSVIRRICRDAGWECEVYSTLQDARAPLSHNLLADAAVVVVGDCRVTAPGNFSTSQGMPGVHRLRDEYPLVPVVLIGDLDREAVNETIELGVEAVLHSPPRTGQAPGASRLFQEALHARMQGAFMRMELVSEQLRARRDELTSLRHRLGVLRREGARTAVSLTLLQHIAERMDRAVLFLCRPKDLLVIGAFGDATGGSTLATQLVGRKLVPESDSLLTKSLKEGTPYEGPMLEQPEFVQLFERIGAPASGRGLVLPILALERVVVVVYGDNGAGWAATLSTDSLEILTSQAGLMIENLLLKKLAKSRAN